MLLLALPLGILTTRAAFFGHDAGHQQIASSRKLHDWVGMVHGNLLLGMSYGWWNDKHNRHHANPNHTDKDPDVGEGILVWTLEQAEGRTGLHGWLTRNQARIFFPLLTLEGFNLKVSSIRFLLGRPRREARLELGLMAAHLVLYFTALFLIMSPGQAVLFALIHHMIFGLHLGSVFAPNHKGMEMPDGDDQLGSPREAGAHLAQRERRPGHRLDDGRPELPDRAPPLPEHAARQPPLRPADRPLVLRTDRHAVRQHHPDRFVPNGSAATCTKSAANFALSSGRRLSRR